MSKDSNFEIKEVNKDKIVLEEEKESNRKTGLFLLFFRKYGKIFRVAVMSLSFTTFVVAGGITLSTIKEESERQHQVDVPSNIILQFEKTSNQVNLDNGEVVEPLDETTVLRKLASGETSPSYFKITNTSTTTSINYRVLLTEYADYSLLNDNCDNTMKLDKNILKYIASVNGTSNSPKLLTNNNTVNNGYIVLEGTLNPAMTDNIGFYLWVDGELATNQHMNKHYHGFITIEYELI